MRTEMNIKNAAADGKENIENTADKILTAGKDAANQVKERASLFAGEVQGGVDDAISSLGTRTRNVADSVRNVTPSALSSTGERVAGVIESGGHYLEEKGATGIINDASKLIKKYPLTSLCIGFGAGVVIARKLSR